MKKCEPDELVYTSMPPQNKCKNCGKFWYCHAEIPNCNIQPAVVPEEKKEGWRDRFDGIFTHKNKSRVKLKEFIESERLSVVREYQEKILAYKAWFEDGNDDVLCVQVEDILEAGKSMGL